MSRDNVFITNIPLETAIDSFLEAIPNPLVVEQIPIREALFRKTAQAVLAKRSSPSDHCAAMDGIVVLAEKTHGANERNPMELIEGVDFDYINTGNLIPSGRNAVIMIEDVSPLREGLVEIIEAAYAWQHIRQVGEDIVEGEMILPSGHTIRAIDLGALLSGGVSEVEVSSQLKVGILPTGNEIIQELKELKKGQIIDSNSRVIEGMLLELGCIPTVYSVAKDEPTLLTAAVEKAIDENDMVITIAGSSAGSKDFTASIIQSLGQVVIHGVAIKPGKPTILGEIANKAIVGLPGYPVSAYFAFDSFVRPLIEKWTQSVPNHQSIEAVLTQRIMSSFKNEERIRVTLGKINEKWMATPLERGAGATMSLVRADGVLTVPRLSEGIEKGEKVDVKLMKSISRLENRLVVIGSHDLLLDFMADQMSLVSSHVGSFGGILAVKNKECHLAPIHLIDQQTGSYNKAIVKKMFPQGGMSLIKGVNRLQGFIVQKGNPKKVQGFEDLLNKSLGFVNRQRGAGTRQLLDYELEKRKLPSGHINGYNREFTTHMAVAAAVQSGSADLGLGIFAAAKTMGLDFIPVGYESYDFLVPSEYLETQGVQEFIRILKSQAFKEQLQAIGGYELEASGELIDLVE